MLYTRASFIKWLTTVKGCELTNLNEGSGRVIAIKNGFITTYMFASPSGLIDYEEIYALCQKLVLTDLPGDKDLKKG